MADIIKWIPEGVTKKILNLIKDEFASNAFLGEHSVMSINELTFFHAKDFYNTFYSCNHIYSKVLLLY